MTTTNTKTSKKKESFWVADIKNNVTARSYEVQNNFLKNQIQRSYKYQHLVYSIHLTLMEREKLFLSLIWEIPKF